MLFVGRDLREQRNFRRLLANASIALLALFLISGTLGGFLVSRSILSRVNELEEVSAAVESGELSVRASLHNRDDEFDRVAAALNRMLTKNQKLVEQLRMATDSLAHDLRTPLAHLTQKLEALALTLQADKMVASQIAAAIAEAQYIQGVFTELLDISRAEAGLASQQFASVDLANIVNDVVDLYEPVAEEKGISISREIELPVHIAGHKQFLSRAIANLLDNAIKFSPDGERIEVTVTRASGCATFTITDSGVGIPREDWESSLGRFARLNAAREGTGAGLGLSLVQSVANLHGARLVQGDKTDGLEVRLEFPAQEQAS